MEPWSKALSGRVLQGRYEVLEPIAAGGMGAVYEARHVALDTKVAIKVLRPELRGDERARSRFVREARLAASVGGTGVVRVFDLGELEGVGPWLVMELLDGESLSAWLDRHAPTSLEAIGELLTPLLETLSLLHARELIHRDIKPSNIFLVREGSRRTVKLLDFGIARLMRDSGSEAITGAGVIVGTPRFMAPEQARTEPPDAQTDLYAVGAILYQAVTGRMPYHDVASGRVLQALIAGPPPPPVWLREDLPPSVDELIRRAMAWEPEDRFGSAEEMSIALRTTLGHSPASSSAPTRDDVPPRTARPRNAAPLDRGAARREATTKSELHGARESGQLADSEEVGRRRVRTRAWWLAGAAAAVGVLGATFAIGSAASRAPVSETPLRRATVETLARPDPPTEEEMRPEQPSAPADPEEAAPTGELAPSAAPVRPRPTRPAPLPRAGPSDAAEQERVPVDRVTDSRGASDSEDDRGDSSDRPVLPEGVGRMHPEEF